MSQETLYAVLGVAGAVLLILIGILFFQVSSLSGEVETLGKRLETLEASVTNLTPKSQVLGELSSTRELPEGYRVEVGTIRVDFPGKLVIDFTLKEWDEDYPLDIMLVPASVRDERDAVVLMVKKVTEMGQHHWIWDVAPGYYRILVDNTDWISPTDTDGVNDTALYSIKVTYLSKITGE